MRRTFDGGYELDDDRARLDLDAIHAYLSNESYWAEGRERGVVERSIAASFRVVGVYSPDGALAGFARAISDGEIHAYLADVFVLPAHRGRGLGTELVREIVDGEPLGRLRWVLHTKDAQELYAKLGFLPPGERIMERPKR